MKFLYQLFVICLVSLVYFYKSESWSGAQPKLAFDIEFIQKIELPHKQKFKKTILGGLSGLSFHNGYLYAVSDDRGRYGDPRIYQFEISNHKDTFKISLYNVQIVTRRKISKNNYILDLEAIAPFKDGWILSSEGDLNKSPKQEPKILFFKNNILNFDFLKLPEEFIPNTEGPLSKGLKNNKAFESLFIDEKKGQLYLASEDVLIQDQQLSGDGSYFLIYDYNLASGRFQFFDKKVLDISIKDKIFLYYGASEITKYKNLFLMLTRGVLFSGGLKYENFLIGFDESKIKDEKKTIQSDFVIPLLDLGTDENLEGMTIYQSNGSEYLIIVSDDNFKKGEKTVFLVYKIKEKK